MEKTKGVAKLTQAQEDMRIQVVDLELKARFWKAQFEIRDYSLKVESLQPEYEKYLEVQKQRDQEALARFQEQIEKLKQQETIKVEQNG